MNKFSSGTILALLALSGMLFLVPFVAPAHATNSSPPTVGFCSSGCGGSESSPIRGGVGTWVSLAITNPSSNSYALTAFTVAAPAGWTLTSCDWYDDYTQNCATGGNSATFFFTSGTTNTPLPPGATSNPEIFVTSPTGVYPLSGTFSMTVQDASSATFYAGNSFSIQAIDPTSAVAITVTPGGSNSVTSYTAGSAAYSVTATLSCTVSGNCPSGTENGVGISWTQNGYNAASTGFSFSPTSGTTSGSGTTSTTFQPTNIATDNVNPSSPTTLQAYVGVAVSQESIATGNAGSTISTVPGTPSSVGYTLTGAAFPNTDWLLNKGTSFNAGGSGTFTGAVLCVATQQNCTGANPANTAVAVSVTDKYSNPIAFGAGGVTFAAGQNIAIQTASGAIFDTAAVGGVLPSTITCGVTAGFVCPAAGLSVNEPFNYYQGAAYASVGILFATITGTYGGSSFSVSGNSGNIETSSFGLTGSGSFLTTAHAAFNANHNVAAGLTYTVEFLLNPVQSNVPVTLAICPHDSCAGTSAGYSGSINGAQTEALISNSTGYVSGTLTVSSSLGAVAYFNATVAQPINGSPKHSWTQASTGSVTTISGAATKFEVSVGVGQTETPSPIKYAYPGETVYVNVITTDNFGNIITNTQNQQIQVNLIATPNTVTATNIYIPQGCAMTNATTAVNTHGFQCTGTLNSFGAVAWTLPSTVGSVASITASGVLNGVVVTSVATTITIISASPTLSVTAPKPVSGFLYTNNQNVQFQGWANASLGYNGLVHMSTLGDKIGSAHWVQNSITGVVNARWSVIATLPANAVTQVNFNATDSKGNTVVLATPYNILVDLTTPTIAFVTANKASVNATSPLTATITAAEGDLNASSVGLTYNGTALAHSAITVTGTNNPGSSVVYTVTATLPVGKWTVVESATTLAGNTGTSSAETVTQIVLTTGSFSLAGSATQTTFAGNPDTITGVYKNNLGASQTITVLGIASLGGVQKGYATGTVTIAAGSSGTFYLSFVGLTPGTAYSITFYVLSSTGVVSSVKTTTAMTA